MSFFPGQFPTLNSVMSVTHFPTARANLVLLPVSFSIFVVSFLTILPLTIASTRVRAEQWSSVSRPGDWPPYILVRRVYTQTFPVTRI